MTIALQNMMIDVCRELINDFSFGTIWDFFIRYARVNRSEMLNAVNVINDSLISTMRDIGTIMWKDIPDSNEKQFIEVSLITDMMCDGGETNAL